MWKEVLIFATLYAFVIGAHLAHKRYAAWKERRAREREAANALAPISPMDVPNGRAHTLAFLVAAVGPHGVEAVKHYVVHLLIYSGYIIPPHK